MTSNGRLTNHREVKHRHGTAAAVVVETVHNSIPAAPAAANGLSLCVLGSGSSGNCSVLRLDRAAAGRKPLLILLDLGLSPRETRHRMAEVGLNLDDVQDAVCTHFDTDHFCRGWIRGGPKIGLTIHYHKHHRRWASRAGADYVRSEIFTEPFEIGGLATFEPVHLPHDELGSFGYRISHNHTGMTLGFATDLGQIPKHLLDTFHDLNILALESNYCPRLQEQSPRPRFLKERIMGGCGHLSNQQSLAAVRRISEQSEHLRHICLLHLSRDCNRPDRIAELYGEKAPELIGRLTISSAGAPTPWLGGSAGMASIEEDAAARRIGASDHEHD